jgi:hypothetical protein
MKHAHVTKSQMQYIALQQCKVTWNNTLNSYYLDYAISCDSMATSQNVKQHGYKPPKIHIKIASLHTPLPIATKFGYNYWYPSL